MDDPFAILNEWLAEARSAGSLRHPGAVCLSTVGSDGNPSARFVDLKEVGAGSLVFCTSIDSPKAVAIEHRGIVALTFWWDNIEKQVRVVGRAKRISDERADVFFRSRPRAAKLASWGSRQSEPMDAFEQVAGSVAAMSARFDGLEVSRPENWGGYEVTPDTIEFLKFSPSRLHERTLFRRAGRHWTRALLQP